MARCASTTKADRNTGPHQRDDDAAVDGDGRGAVDLGRLDDLVVDAAQAGEKHRHDEARRLPDGGNDDGVDRELAFLDPAEGEALPAPVLHDVLKADARVEEPFPGDAGDDEGQRHGIEIDRAQEAFAADLLVEQDGEAEAEQAADDDVERGEDRQVLQRRDPVGMVEQPHVVAEADPGRQVRHQLGAGEGQDAGEDDEAVDEQQDEREARRKHELRQPFLQCRARRCCHAWRGYR